MLKEETSDSVDMKVLIECVRDDPDENVKLT